MSNQFEIIGKMMIGKESDKFKPYAVNTYDSGWVSNELKFNAIAGDNRHLLTVKGGYFKNGSGKVYTFSKNGKSENGEIIKGEKLEIAWKDRFNPDIIENVAEFKKFIVDLEEPKKRFKLEKAVEGTLSDEELAELDIEDVVKALEDSKKKRREFIAEADFAEYLHKVIASGKVDSRLFKIIGDITYRPYNGKFYKTITPTRIYLAEKDAKPSSTAQMTVFFNKNCIDDSLFKKTGKYYLNTFVRNYDNQRKEDVPCPVSLVIDTNKDESDDKMKKLNALMLKQFTVKDKSWKEIGVKVNLLDGSQKMEITDDMLTDFQKELLELEAITLDEIRKEMGGNVYGEKIQEMVIINAAKGYSKGVKDTKYVDSDFVLSEVELKTNNKTDEEIFPEVDIDDDDVPF